MAALQEKGSHSFPVPFVAPTGGVSSGDICIIVSGATGLCGIAATDIAATETGTLLCGGIFKVPKETGTGETFTHGAAVYRDATSGKATASATGNTLLGWSYEDATVGTAATEMWVKLRVQR